MALRDVVNFNFLKKAIEQRYRFRNDPNNINYKSFKGIPYEPTTNPHSIFGRIYNTFRELIQTKKLVLNQYLNIGEKSVLEKLYLNLKKDPNLKFLDMPDSALNDPRYQLSDEYYQSQPKEITDAQQAEQVPTSTSGGGSVGGMPRMPSAPSISLPRVIRDFKTPHTTQTPKPDIAIANKSGVIKEAPSGAKLVTADSSGALKGLGGESPTSKIFLDKGGTISEHTIKSPSRWNPSAFRSRISNVAKRIQNFAGRANPFLKTNLNRIFQGFKNMGGSLLGSLGGFGKDISGPGLTRTANFLGNNGLRGVNAGANFFGGARNQVARIRRISNKASSAAKSVKDRRGLLILLGLIGFMILTGILAISGANQTGTTGGTPIGSSDISQCKFTRGDRSPKEASFKSPLLLSYIQEASGLTKIPAAVLAAFIRVESPSTVDFTDEQVKGYRCIETDPGKNVSDTGALGIMQLQPEGTKGNDSTALAIGAKLIGKEYSQLTKADYCDVRKSIIMGAGFILMKISYKGMKTSPPNPEGIYPVYGDGTQWNPSWTNDIQAISKLVNGYYGCLQYPSCITGPYNYATDVSTSIQNCKANISPPLPEGDLLLTIKNRYHIEFDSYFSNKSTLLTWAWEALSASETTAPNFIPLLQKRYPLIKIITTTSVSHTSGDTIAFSTAGSALNSTEQFFKQSLIHELAHVLHGPRTDPTYGAGINEAVSKDEGFLTGYAQGSTADPTAACKSSDSGETVVQLDENFSETVSYYINKEIPEQNYSYNCPPKNSQINPLASGKYPNHIQFIKGVLGGNNF